MKTFSSALDAHYQQDALTTCKAWRVTLLDGRVYGFTDLDEDFSYLGLVFMSVAGFMSSAIAQDTSLSVGSQEIDGQTIDQDLTQADIEAGLWDGAKVELWRLNYEDLSAGHEILSVAEIGQMSIRDHRLNVEVRGFLQRLQNEQGRVFLPTCDLVLGEQGNFLCNVDMTGFTHAGTVTTATDRAHFTATALAQATNYFQFGVVTWTGGANAGRRMEVKNFTTGGIFELAMPMATAIAVGDTFSATAGCDKLLATCRDKFANVVNFGGFPTVPGMPKLIGEVT